MISARRWSSSRRRSHIARGTLVSCPPPFFAFLGMIIELTTWQTRSGSSGTASLTISRYLLSGKRLLNLPQTCHPAQATAPLLPARRVSRRYLAITRNKAVSRVRATPRPARTGAPAGSAGLTCDLQLIGEQVGDVHASRPRKLTLHSLSVQPTMDAHTPTRNHMSSSSADQRTTISYTSHSPPRRLRTGC